jgi:hypothetical protein
MSKSAQIYQLILGKSVGPIQLGSPRESVIQILGKPDSSKESNNFGRTDYYDEEELRISYNKKTGLCDNIGIYSPAELQFKGINLFSLKWDEALTWIRELDPFCELDEDRPFPSCTSHKLQLSINALDTGEGFDSEGNGNYVLVVGSLTIFSPNYWDLYEKEKELLIQQEIDKLPSEEECLRELGLL